REPRRRVRWHSLTSLEGGNRAREGRLAILRGGLNGGLAELVVGLELGGVAELLQYYWKFARMCVIISRISHGVIADRRADRFNRCMGRPPLAKPTEMEAIMADNGTAKLTSLDALRLSPAERRLLARMPLHAITSVHGEAGLRHRLSLEITAFPATEYARIVE